MSRRLDPNAAGASVTLGVRFDAAALAVIDREARRLEALTGEVCDRSRALRSIVRRFEAELETSTAAPSPGRAAVDVPKSPQISPKVPTPGGVSTARSSKTSTRSPSPARATPAPAPSKDPPTEARGRWVKVSAADLRQLARELAALDASALRACIDEAGVARSQVYSARNGKAGEPTYRALRAWLDNRKR